MHNAASGAVVREAFQHQHHRGPLRGTTTDGDPASESIKQFIDIRNEHISFMYCFD